MAVAAFAPEICNGLDDDWNGSPESPTNTWTANGDGLHWQDPANWSSGFVPLECQDVIVPAGANVTLPTGINGKGRTLDVPVEVQFQVEGAGVLEIGN